jgi:NAD(P)-dependent dehydrogenase (short-subunit alcohol dehydrogenase family)
MSKTILITGATAGIGYHLAKTLAVDHKVIVASRSAAKVGDTIKEIADAGNTAQGYTLNLNSLAAIDEFLEMFTKEQTVLDVLVLNAGVSMPSMELSGEGFETTFATNHLGHFYLTEKLLPLLKKSKGRVLVVSSGTHDPANISGVA